MPTNHPSQYTELGIKLYINPLPLPSPPTIISYPYLKPTHPMNPNETRIKSKENPLSPNHSHSIRRNEAF